MKISVVMATYNGEKYIREQLDSILNQTRIPNEIIISDDGSKDGTRVILQEYSERYENIVKIFFNEKQLGYSKNFWQALHYTTGDIIILSDQDDIWKNNKIEIIQKLFIKHSEIKALSTAYELIDSNSEVYKDIRNVVFFNNEKLKKISWKNFIKHPKFPGMSMAIRRKEFEELLEKQYEKMPPHDWLLNQRAAFLDGMYFYDKILTQYRQHDNNLIGSSANLVKKNYKQRRIKTIYDLKMSLQFLKKNYSDYDINYMNKIIKLCNKRILYLKKESLVKIFFIDMINFKYISFRSILGDMYYLLKIKRNSGEIYDSYYDGDL